MLKDADEFINLDEHLVFYPSGATVANPSVNFKQNRSTKRIAVLNPVNSVDNIVTMVLPTKLSQNILLRFSFDILQSGLLDI